MANAQVFRTEKTGNFTIISNYHLTDRRLSANSIALLTLMLSLPPTWDYSVSGLASIRKEGKYATRKALNELEKYGYLKREQLRDAAGAFIGTKYFIYEQSTKTQESKKTKKKSKRPFFNLPKANNPQPDNPQFDNSTQLRTNLNQELTEANTNSMAKRALVQRFKDFWAVCPKKRDKQECLEWWEINVNSDEMAENIINGMKTQAKSKEWSEENGKYRPRPINWLNDERWGEILTENRCSYDVDKVEKDSYFKIVDDFSDYSTGCHA